TRQAEDRENYLLATQKAKDSLLDLEKRINPSPFEEIYITQLKQLASERLDSIATSTPTESKNLARTFGTIVYAFELNELAQIDELARQMDHVLKENRWITLSVSVFSVLLTVVALVLAERRRKQQIAVEIETLSTNQYLIRQKLQLTRLLEAQNAIATVELNSSRIMDTIVHQTMQLTGADGAVVEILEGDDMVYKAADGIVAKFLGLRLPLGESLSGLSLQTDTILLCEDTEIDRRVNLEACRKISARSMIVLPLKHRDQQIGLLKACSKQPGYFTEAHVTTLKFLVGVLASALGQAYEFEDKSRIIASLREAEAKLTEMKDRAERSAEEKAHLLSSMSHEIRTPLNGILGMTRLMGTVSSPQKQLEYAKDIERSGRLLQMLVNNLLDFSKIEAGKMELESVVFDLQDSIHGVTRALNYQAKQKNIALELQIDPAIKRFVRGDMTRLAQVMLNLVSNALKFTAKGFVTIRVFPIHNAQANLRFEVEDTGIGIKPEAVKTLFQSFRQAGADVTRRFGGSGLGLAISKRLVEMMGGEIGVTSQMGQGSIFWFTAHLPEQEVAAPWVTSEEEETVLGSAKQESYEDRILVAEDNPVNQMITIDMLGQLGFNADVANNGQEALRALDNGIPYRLVFMDCEMPEMNGYETTMAIRQRTDSYKSIPIIAITANAYAGDRERCLACGMSDYLSKPVEVMDLRRVLRKWLPLREVRASPSLALQEIPATLQSQHVDFNRLRSIAGSFGPENYSRIAELIRVYLRTMPKYLTPMTELFMLKQWSELIKIVHAIKSSSANLGAHVLSERARELEQNCLHNPQDVRAEHLEAIRSEFAFIVTDFEKLLTHLEQFQLESSGSGAAN
ncbi:MAG: response regulator, partial [Bdellovibrionales bacterium]|nr:response regulator [Bdellovibrionales bacterium]